MRLRQNGSVINFVLVGVVLVAALVTTVYLVNRRADYVREQQPIVVEEDDKPVIPEEVANEEADVTVENQEAGVAGTNDLPDTGISLTLGEITAIAFLTWAVASYVLSRHSLVHSL